MMTCQEVQQLIPWYVTGRIKIETAREIAEHLTTCAECQADFVEAAWMRRLLMTSTREAAPRAAVWSRIEKKTGLADLAKIDVGSLLLGLKLGISASPRRYPVRGTLRVMGHNVRIVGRRRGKEAKRVQE
jgi:hypothetical protein